MKPKQIVKQLLEDDSEGDDDFSLDLRRYQKDIHASSNLDNATFIRWLNANGMEKLVPKAGTQSLHEFWKSNSDEEELIEIAVKARVPRQQIIRAVCACIRESLFYLPIKRKEPYRALDAAEGFAAGKVSAEEVRAARQASETAAREVFQELGGPEDALATTCYWVAYGAFCAAHMALVTSDAKFIEAGQLALHNSPPSMERKSAIIRSIILPSELKPQL